LTWIFAEDALSDLGFLDISVDTYTDSRVWDVSLELADRFRLTLYDAGYVELAPRRRFPLATLDKEMRSAGAALGLPLLGADQIQSSGFDIRSFASYAAFLGCAPMARVACGGGFHPDSC
jgi:hypothetical protein